MARVIINADDYGMNEKCSKAIAEAFDRKLITDTTAIVNSKFCAEALMVAKKKGFSNRIGIHFNLTEGNPLTEEILRCPRFVQNGEFRKDPNRIKPLSKCEYDAVYRELSAQISFLEKNGISVTHADSHHHIHTGLALCGVFVKVCKEHKIEKIRIHRNYGDIRLVKKWIKYLYNTWLRIQGFKTTRFFGAVADCYKQLPSKDFELMVHPDYDENGCLVDRILYVEDKVVGAPLAEIIGNDWMLSIGSYEEL